MLAARSEACGARLSAILGTRETVMKKHKLEMLASPVMAQPNFLSRMEGSEAARQSKALQGIGLGAAQTPYRALAAWSRFRSAHVGADADKADASWVETQSLPGRAHHSASEAKLTVGAQLGLREECRS